MPKGVPKNRGSEGKSVDATKKQLKGSRLKKSGPPIKLPPEPREPQLNERQELFALLVGRPDERGRPRTLSSAYLGAGYKFDGKPEHLRVTACEQAKTPHIAKRIAEYRAAYALELAEMTRSGLCIQAERLVQKQTRHNLLMDLLAARQRGLIGMSRRIEDLQNEIANEEDDLKRKALEAKLDNILSQFGVGEDTGLLARDFKSLGDKAVPIFKLDKALLDALNDLENDTAKELGQIVTKTQEVPVSLDGWSAEDLAAYERVVSKIAEGPR